MAVTDEALDTDADQSDRPRRSRWPLFLLVATIVWIAVALAVVPISVGFGAGRFACGAPIAMKDALGSACGDARGGHVMAIVGLAASLLAIDVLAVAGQRIRAVGAASWLLWVVVAGAGMIWLGRIAEFERVGIVT